MDVQLEVSDKFLKSRDRLIGASLSVIVVDHFNLSGPASVFGVNGLTYSNIASILILTMTYFAIFYFIRLYEERYLARLAAVQSELDSYKIDDGSVSGDFYRTGMGLAEKNRKNIGKYLSTARYRYAFDLYCGAIVFGIALIYILVE